MLKPSACLAGASLEDGLAARAGDRQTSLARSIPECPIRHYTLPVRRQEAGRPLRQQGSNRASVKKKKKKINGSSHSNDTKQMQTWSQSNPVLELFTGSVL